MARRGRPSVAPLSRADNGSGLSSFESLLWCGKGGFASPGPDGPDHHMHDIRLLRAGSVLSTVGASALLGLPCAIALGEKRHGARDMPRRQNTEAVKMRRLKKADCEVDFFFIVELHWRMKLCLTRRNNQQF